jgi:hypothetical protein
MTTSRTTMMTMSLLGSWRGPDNGNNVVAPALNGGNFWFGLLKLTLYFIVVQPDKYIGIQDNIYIMTICSTAAPIPLPALVCPLFGIGRLVARIWHVLNFATFQFPRTSYRKPTVC